MKIKIKNFLLYSTEDEAKKLVRDSVDWYGNSEVLREEKFHSKEFQPIKLENLSDSFLPPSIQKILLGIEDGKKRALFILINLFRSIGMEKEEIEKRIFSWNSKNPLPLKEGYIKTQIMWSYRNKIAPPPNFDKDYYRGIGIIPTEEELRLKNPINYILKKANAMKK